MTALFTSCSVREKSAITGVLLSLIFWVYPESLVLALSDQNQGQNQPLVFEVKNPIPNSNTRGLQIEEVAENDPLVNNLRIYLEKYNSPLAEYADQIVLQNDWQKALAISWVESNFGRFCFDNNCSGIGVKPGHPAWRKYPSKLEWFKDLSLLLQKPVYNDRFNTCRKMKGVYVQPGTENWVRGCEQKFKELTRLTSESEQQRQLIVQAHSERLALTTFAENPDTDSN